MSNHSFLTRLLHRRIPFQEKISFASHLALVVKAGLPLFTGLTIIKSQAQSRTLRFVIDDLLEDVSNGKTLAAALERYEYLFGGFFVNVIAVGEASGTLSSNLLYLAGELKKSRRLVSKVRSAMIYPMVILIATLAVSGFLAFYVFPKLLPVFSNLNVKLPLTTQVMIGVLGFLKSYFPYLIVGLAALVVGARIIVKKVGPVKHAVHFMILWMPVLSGLAVAVNMTNFTRVMALLLKSGVKILEAVAITASTFENVVYKRALLAARDEIQKGGQLSGYLSRRKHIFPPLVVGMLQVGENTGNLEENLGYLAEYYDEEVDTKLRGLTSVVEPLMLLLMGLLVGFVALSIITPIYSISQSFK